jgi:hypothetical protein
MNTTKNIVVSDSCKIFSIQEKFNTLFPYLRLELFLPGTDASNFSRTMNEKSRSLESYRTTNKTGSIVISPQMTVLDLEQHFKMIYGLSAQVFRKSGKVWLETTVTDSWTLEEQNRQGESLSKNNV